MKIAALSLLSAHDAISAHRSSASSDAAYDYRRDGDRRRKPRVTAAVRTTPPHRMVTGLAIQIIAQIEKPAAPNDAVAAARAAYRPVRRSAGEILNCKA